MHEAAIRAFNPFEKGYNKGPQTLQVNEASVRSMSQVACRTAFRPDQRAPDDGMAAAFSGLPQAS